MSPKHLVAAAALMVIAFATIAVEPVVDRYDLKDGTTLYVHTDGTMRMIDRQGKPMSMSDDVEMELKDGRRLMMKNHRIWMQVGLRGKGFEYLHRE